MYRKSQQSRWLSVHLCLDFEAIDELLNNTALDFFKLVCLQSSGCQRGQRLGFELSQIPSLASWS